MKAHALALIKAARDKIAAPENYAVDEFDRVAPPVFTLFTAIYLSVDEHAPFVSVIAITAIHKHFGMSMDAFCRTHTHSQVIEALDQVISTLEQDHV